MRPTILQVILWFHLPAAALAKDDVWEPQYSTVAASLRGISAVSETCCWASGAAGTVVRTVDGGKSWLAVGPANSEGADFRDIQALDESTAVIMSAGDVDRLYRTDDGGMSWVMVYEHPEPIAFFDGMSFDKSKQHGWLMGDPIGGRLHLLKTHDAGRTWTQRPPESSPAVAGGIAAFAASGTHLLCISEQTLLIGLGGANAVLTQDTQASVLRTSNAGAEWQNVSVPIKTGQSAGVFSIASIERASQRLILVGGDYLKPDQDTDNVAISDDAGRSWRLPTTSRPTGFRSAVVSVTTDTCTLLLASGPSGTDQSTDGGESWARVSGVGFHTMSFVSLTNGWAAGSEGRIARWRVSQ